MKAVKGYTKEHYKSIAPTTKEFDTIEKASEYLANKYKESKVKMIKAIKDDTNCDAIYFEDKSVIILEF